MPDYSKDEWQRMIESYNRELMAQYAAAASSAAPQSPLPSEPTPPPAPPAPESPPLAPPETTPMPEPSPPMSLGAPPAPPENLPDIGVLQVRVSTEDQAVPIEGAVVTITHDFGNGRVLDRTMLTDNSGLTPLVELPTKDRALSMRPGNPSPFAEYTVEVVADGYYTKRFERIPIFGGVTAIQSVSMLPLPEFTENDLPLVYNESEQPTL